MSTELPTPRATGKPKVFQWFAWGVLILVVGTVGAAAVGMCMTASKDGVDIRKWPFLLPIALFVVLFFCLKAALHPIRSRGDEQRSWQEQFPTRSDEEVRRFVRTVGDSLGLREAHRCRLRPDDRVRDLTQEVFCGDGMDVIELVMDLEMEYALELPDALLEEARTLGDLFDYVVPLRVKGPPPSAAKQGGKLESS
jgi:acyl carrier protein